MSILPALVGYYEHYERRESEFARELPGYGFSRERISYAIVLSSDGHVVDVVPRLDTSGKVPRPTLLPVPQAAVRTSGIVANFLWDNTAYVLGVKRDKQGGSANQWVFARREHDAFKELHLRLLPEINDEGLTAVCRFVAGWQPREYDGLRYSGDMLDTNVVFQLDGEACLVHEREVVQNVWRAHLAADQGGEGLCLVTGDRAPIRRLHAKIKGVRGAQSSGASIVSFNLSAFESFGKNQGANAPISERAAFAYTAALNTLLAPDSDHRIQIADSTTVFWAEATAGQEQARAAEDLFSLLVDPPTDAEEAAAVADKLRDIESGRPLAEVAPAVREDTRFHVLGLAPNAARLSIRFWYEDTIGTIGERIRQHWQDLRLEPTPWRTSPAVWRLLRETGVQGKSENVPPTLAGALMRAILGGGRYPQSLLAAVIGRMRADGRINGLRVAICKACLARDYRLGFAKEDVPVSLDTDETNPAYRLGRLFAVYERVQRSALGSVNATIKDRYFGAASATPAAVFPLLVRNAAHHLATLRKDRGGLAHWFEQEIDTILGGIDTVFPSSLRLEDQGRFALGYHHQRWAGHGAVKEADASAEADIQED